MRVSFRRFPGHSSAYSVIERDDGVVYRMKEFTRAGTRLAARCPGRSHPRAASHEQARPAVTYPFNER